MLKVCEIFSSIQGESTYQGLPCSFVRLSGCNLRCTYCDTAYAHEEGYETGIDEIVSRVGGMGLALVEITGGEPLLQPEAGLLLDALVDEGLTVLVETNGSINIAPFNGSAVYIMDFKTPSSSMDRFNDFSNVSFLKKEDEVKFVISGAEDYEWAIGVCGKYELFSRVKVLMSPVFGVMDAGTLSSWIIRDRLKARLNVQIHKHIYGSGSRGV